MCDWSLWGRFGRISSIFLNCLPVCALFYLCCSSTAVIIMCCSLSCFCCSKVFNYYPEVIFSAFELTSTRPIGCRPESPSHYRRHTLNQLGTCDEIHEVWDGGQYWMKIKSFCSNSGLYSFLCQIFLSTNHLTFKEFPLLGSCETGLIQTSPLKCYKIRIKMYPIVAVAKIFCFNFFLAFTLLFMVLLQYCFLL